jgi:hypothetical protein
MNIEINKVIEDIDHKIEWCKENRDNSNNVDNANFHFWNGGIHCLHDLKSRLEMLQDALPR